MAQITLQKLIAQVTTKSVLTILEDGRTGDTTYFSLNAKTNLVYSNAYVGTGIAIYGIVEISGTGITTQTKTLTLKPTNAYWSGTTVHTIDDYFVVNIPTTTNSITVKYTVYHSDVPSDKMSGTATMSLTKLISQLGAISGGKDYEKPLTVTVTQYNSEYTQDLILYFRDAENNYTQIAKWDNVPAGQQEYQLTTEQINHLFSLTPNDKFFSLTWALETYIDDTLLGTATTPHIGIVSNANPIFEDFDYEDVNPSTIAVTGNNQTIVKGISTLKITIPVSKKATAIKYALMSSYMIGDYSVDYSENSDVVLEIPKFNADTITVTAVDSRGKNTPIIKTLNTLEYETVSVESTSATISRTNDSEEQTKISFNGTFFAGNFGAVDNGLTTSYKYRFAGSTGEYTKGITPIVLTISDNKYSVSNQIILGDTDTGFDTSKSYEIVVEIEDKLSVNQITYTLGPGLDALVIEGNKVIMINGKPFLDYVIVDTW